MTARRKIRQLVPRLHTTNRTRRAIVYELSQHRHDQIVFAARRADNGRWYAYSDAQHDMVFYACELIVGRTRTELIAEHLNRIERGDGGT